MWVADWLFGSRRSSPYEGRIETRSRTLPLDAVQEIVAIARQLGAAELRIVDDESTPLGTLDPADLATAPDWERSRLQLVAGNTAVVSGRQLPLSSLIVVELRRNVPSSVTWRRFDPASGDIAPLADPGQLAYKIADKLIREGRPRLRWRPLAHKAPYLVPLLLIACWTWFWAAEQPPLSLGVAGLTLIPVTYLAAYNAVGIIKNYAPSRVPGNKIRTFSRADLRQERANRHANIRTSAITALITAPPSIFLGVVVQRYFSR